MVSHVASDGAVRHCCGAASVGDAAAIANDAAATAEADNIASESAVRHRCGTVRVGDTATAEAGNIASEGAACHCYGATSLKMPPPSPP